jgi:predicted nucleic acid-binding protein
MQGDKTFIDSNLIIYAYDISAGKKHEIASKIMLDLWNSELGVLSTQVLQEFFFNITQKIPKPLNVKAAISSGTTILLSEDFSDGQIVEGVKIKNPFI